MPGLGCVPLGRRYSVSEERWSGRCAHWPLRGGARSDQPFVWLMSQLLTQRAFRCRSLRGMAGGHFSWLFRLACCPRSSSCSRMLVVLSRMAPSISGRDKTSNSIEVLSLTDVVTGPPQRRVARHEPRARAPRSDHRGFGDSTKMEISKFDFATRTVAVSRNMDL